MSSTFSPTGDISHRGKWIPLPEWQENKRMEKVTEQMENEDAVELTLRLSVCIAAVAAFCWIIIPGLLNIWRG